LQENELLTTADQTKLHSVRLHDAINTNNKPACGITLGRHCVQKRIAEIPRWNFKKTPRPNTKRCIGYKPRIHYVPILQETKQ